MSADGISTLSGMMYSFSRAQAEHLLQWFREYAGELAPQPLPDTETSFMTRRAWLAQFLEEPERLCRNKGPAMLKSRERTI
jgi:hypothetical protein